MSGYCEELCAFQPEGPVCLAGYSFSGLLAYEMARQLHARGREVQLLAIIDTGPGRPTPLSPSGALMNLCLFLRNLPRWIRDDLLQSQLRALPGRTERYLRKTFKRVMLFLRRTPSSVPVMRFEDMFDTNEFPEALCAHANDALRTLAGFQFRPFPGRIVLFRARTHALFSFYSRDLGWSELVRGGLEIVEIPGTHATILRLPHVRVLAEKFRATLDASAAIGAATACRVNPLEHSRPTTPKGLSYVRPMANDNPDISPNPPYRDWEFRTAARPGCCKPSPSQSRASCAGCSEVSLRGSSASSWSSLRSSAILANK